MQPDPVHALLDELSVDVGKISHAFFLAHTTLQLGEYMLASANDSATLTMKIGVDISTEPLPIGELKQYQDVFPQFLLEVFHGNLVKRWQDCLTAIFAHYVDLHLDGSRCFTELKTKQVRLDFGSSRPMVEQVRDWLVLDFGFDDYAERQKLINHIRNPENLQPEHLARVHMNVLLRNARQHGKSIDAHFFKKLGMTNVSVLDATGTPCELHEGDAALLSIPGLDEFRRSILLIAQLWRQTNA